MLIHKMNIFGVCYFCKFHDIFIYVYLLQEAMTNASKNYITFLLQLGFISIDDLHLAPHRTTTASKQLKLFLYSFVVFFFVGWGCCITRSPVIQFYCTYKINDRTVVGRYITTKKMNRPICIVFNSSSRSCFFIIIIIECCRCIGHRRPFYIY